MALSSAAQKVRSKGIGSSEIAMLIYLEDDNGDMKPLSPWGGRHKLWRRKTGKDGEQKAQSYMTRGQYMEQGLMNWYADDNGVKWIAPKTLVHADYPYVVDSCDGLTFDGDTTVKLMKEFISKGTGAAPLRCLEAKTSSYWKRDEWGEAGTDDVPSYYLVQCMWHLGIHKPQEMICDVPMDNGTKRTDYHVAFDEELYLSLVAEAEKFWVDHVLADKEPDIDSYSDTTSWLCRYLKQKEGMGVLEANDEQIQVMLTYRNYALTIKQTEVYAEEAREKLMRVIGEYDGILVPGTKQKILWKQSKDTMGVDWKAVAEHLAQQMHVDGAMDKEAFRQLKDANEKITRKGNRRWTPTALLKNAGKGEEEGVDDGTA